MLPRVLSRKLLCEKLSPKILQQGATVQQHSETGTERVGYQVIHPGVPGRQIRLQPFDREAGEKPDQNGHCRRIPCCVHGREVNNKKAERDMTNDVDTDVFPVSPSRMIMAPWQ